MLIFVCAPLKANFYGTFVENLTDMGNYCAHVVGQGHRPVCVHRWLARWLNEKNPRERYAGRVAALGALRACDELWAFGPYISVGMLTELRTARRLGVPIKFVRKVPTSRPLPKKGEKWGKFSGKYKYDPSEWLRHPRNKRNAGIRCAEQLEE